MRPSGAKAKAVISSSMFWSGLSRSWAWTEERKKKELTQSAQRAQRTRRRGNGAVMVSDAGQYSRSSRVFAKLLFRGADVGDAESDVVHDTECVMVSVGGDVEHVFEPVGAVGDLHVDPAGFVICSSAMPINMEAEDVFVEAIFGGAVMND